MTLPTKSKPYRYRNGSIPESLMSKKIDRIQECLNRGWYILKDKRGFLIPQIDEVIIIEELVVREMHWRGLIKKVSDNKWEKT